MRGFITIATGSEHYYKLARQLLRSLRCVCKEKIPFALICDCENEYTVDFDYVIILDQPQRSYMDKLQMYQYSPFDETIFIDADSLFLCDPMSLWEDFSGASSVSCFGNLYPIGSDDGWFRYEKTGKWKDCIKYQIALHGGIYYFRKNAEAKLVFETAIQLAKEYSDYDFKDFVRPADEPVMALSMAIYGCMPVANVGSIIFYHSYYGRLSLNESAELLLDGKPCDTVVCHFATKNTYCFMYRYMSEMVDIKYSDPSSGDVPNSRKIRNETWHYDVKARLAYVGKRILKRILPISKIKKVAFRLFAKPKEK